MANILLLEPGYKNKYPPLGLMKLAFYHKEIKKDYVRFVKGPIGEYENSINWDRIYITTLFTFEWKEIEKTIDEAIKLQEDRSRIYVGGIAATLLADILRKRKPGINVIEGLLNEKGKIEYDDDDIIENLPPDYDILEDIKGIYSYPTENAYFAYTTRGCGMNCSFCAVKTLEPKYEECVSIKEQINQVKERYGEKKDLLLMDNNVLKSRYLDRIVEEIKGLGFAKGKKYYNPLTGNEVKRAVDFNQGLDAYLISEEKANLLAQLELRPVRIAFDHIQDKEVYENAITICAKAGLREFSNYILYNSPESKGKGKVFPADTPQQLYERLILNVYLQEKLSNEIGEKISIYSFPMRYIPLEDLERGYVGPEWERKYLRVIQVMLIPTRGKGVSGRSFFEADFGLNVEEFSRTLLMPERLITSRGAFLKKREGESEKEREKRERRRKIEKGLIDEWNLLFNRLNDNEKKNFIDIIGKNRFTIKEFNLLNTDNQKKLLLRYLTPYRLFSLVEQLEGNDENTVRKHILDKEESSYFFADIITIINENNPSINYIKGFIHLFKEKGIEPYFKRLLKPSDRLLFNEVTEKKEEKVENIKNSYFNEWNKNINKLRSLFNFYNQIKLGEKRGIELFKEFDYVEKRAYIFYLSEYQILNLLNELDNEKDIYLLKNYLVNESPVVLETLVHYILMKSESASNNISLTGFIRVLGEDGVTKLLKIWIKSYNKSLNILKILSNGFSTLRASCTDLDLWELIHIYDQYNCLSEVEIDLLLGMVHNKDYKEARKHLEEKFNTFKGFYLSKGPNDFTREVWEKGAIKKLDNLYDLYFNILF